MTSSRASPVCVICRAESAPFPPEQISTVGEQLHQAPPALAPEAAPARWSLKHLGAVCEVLADYSLSGIWRLLDAWGLTYKRGRDYLHSPDPHYEQKRDYAQRCVDEARQADPRAVALYLDEMSYYRQPTLGRDWSARGAAHQPLARYSYHQNSRRRVVAALDVVTGAVLSEQGLKIGVKQLSAFYQRLRGHYPKAQTIYVIQDNWFVHFHPQVIEAARTAQVDVVPLPTYSPWLNPIEKLWRQLRQEVLHMHRLSDQWEQLQQRVMKFLESLAGGSQSLLHYVGLLPD